MDKESAAAAQKKAKGLIPKVGYPLTPNTTDAESLQKWYGRVEIKADDAFGNALRTILVNSARTWMSLGQKRDRQSWEVSYTPHVILVIKLTA
jgi:endothelin-converting enzyme